MRNARGARAHPPRPGRAPAEPRGAPPSAPPPLNELNPNTTRFDAFCFHTPLLTEAPSISTPHTHTITAHILRAAFNSPLVIVSLFHLCALCLLVYCLGGARWATMKRLPNVCDPREERRSVGVLPERGHDFPSSRHSQTKVIDWQMRVAEIVRRNMRSRNACLRVGVTSR